MGLIKKASSEPSAEVVKQRVVVCRDGEEGVGGIEIGVGGRMEVKAKELGARGYREGVSELGGEDTSSHVRNQWNGVLGGGHGDGRCIELGVYEF